MNRKIMIIVVSPVSSIPQLCIWNYIIAYNFWLKTIAFMIWKIYVWLNDWLIILLSLVATISDKILWEL